MPEVEIQIKNLGALKRAFRDYPKISEPVFEQAIHGSAAALAKHTTRATVPFKTGRLLQSFIPSFGRLQARWSPTVRYAIFVHEGTRPHDIYPVIKRALFWKGAAHPVKVVHHPGTRAQPFMKDIAQRSTEDINRLFVQALDKIMGQIAKIVNAEA